MDHNGCHLADGANAIPDTPGWYCNCCGMAVKTKYTQRSAHEVIATKSTRSNLDNDSENLAAKIKTILKDDLPKKRLFEYIDANIQYVNKKDLRSILRDY